MSDLDKDKMDEGIDSSRRGFTKLGVGAGLSAPVLMSLASRPVFGGDAHGLPAACLSDMMSGNASHEHELKCRLGWSPGGWKNPGGRIDGVSTPDAWAAAGFNFGTHTGGDRNECENWSGTSTVADMRADASIYPSGGTFLSSSNPGDSLMCVLETNSIDKFCITAYLNAKFVTNYVLTPAQVVGLCTGLIPVPPPPPEGPGDLQDFLDDTWNGF